MFFYNNPEVFFTINLVTGLLYKGRPFLWILGGLFVLLSVFLLLAKKRFKIVYIKFNQMLLALILFFWLPVFINLTYNNVSDSLDNLEYTEYDTSGKRIIRLCNMDFNQNGGGACCQTFSFISYAKNKLPEKSTIKLVTSPFLLPFLHYYLYPYFNFSDSIDNADYLLYYWPEDFYYNDGVLYKKISGDSYGYVGKYLVIGNMGPHKLILEKIKE